jgi:acetate kinase
MGLTPLDGLVMGTRCGTVDPGVLLYLMQEERMSADELEHLLYEKSGLLGVSGMSADMRVLLESRDAAAREAVELFSFRVAAEVAMMANTLAGFDGLVFTGGIGEHSATIRQEVCNRLAWLGVRVEPAANAEGRQSIGAAGSSVDVLVIPTSEETVIARHCATVLDSRTLA